MAETTGASILALSAQIWQWMSAQDVDRLEQLIDGVGQRYAGAPAPVKEDDQ